MKPKSKARRQLLSLSILLPLCLFWGCEQREATGPAQPATAPAKILHRLEGNVQLRGRDSHAGVHIFLGGTPHSLWTDSKGRFVFEEVSPGQYELIAQKSGYRDVVTLLELTDDASSAQIPPIVLSPLGAETQPTTSTSINTASPTPAPSPAILQTPAQAGNRRLAGGVIILDEQGALSNDFPAITVYIDQLNLSSPLGPDGSFSFDGLPPRLLTVTARGEGYKLETPVIVDLSEAEEATAVLRVQASAPSDSAAQGGSVIGSILLPEQAEEARSIRVSLAGSSFSGITDADGLFELSGIPEGNYALVIDAEGFDTLQLPDVMVLEGEATDVGQLMLELDISEPEVLDTLPADGARRVAVQSRTPVKIRFSEPMDRSSVKQSIQITPSVNHRAYMGNEHPQSSESVLLIELIGETTSLPVEFGTRYTIAISDAASSAEGVPLAEPFEMSFTTAGPALVDWRPRDNSTDVGVDLNRSVLFRLNDRLHPETELNKFVHVRPRLDTDPRVQATYETRTGWSEIRIFGIWKPDTAYRVTLDRGLKNANGVRFDNLPKSLSFRTAALVPLLPLSVDDISEYPARGTRGIR